MPCIQAKQLLIHATPAEIAELMSSEASRGFLHMNSGTQIQMSACGLDTDRPEGNMGGPCVISHHGEVQHTLSLSHPQSVLLSFLCPHLCIIARVSSACGSAYVCTHTNAFAIAHATHRHCTQTNTHTHRDTDTRTDTEACTGHRSPVVSGWWQVNSAKQHFARQAQQVRIRTSPHVSGFVGNDPTDFVTAPFLRLCL